MSDNTVTPRDPNSNARDEITAGLSQAHALAVLLTESPHSDKTNRNAAWALQQAIERARAGYECLGKENVLDHPSPGAQQLQPKQTSLIVGRCASEIQTANSLLETTMATLRILIEAKEGKDSDIVRMAWGLISHVDNAGQCMEALEQNFTELEVLVVGARS